MPYPPRDYSAGCDAVGEAEARAEVLIVGMDERAVVETTAGRLDQCVGGGIEVRPVVIALPEGRCEFPSQAEVQCQLGRDAVIVLKIKRVHVLAQITDELVAELDGAGKPEDEVGQVVTGGVARDFAAGGLTELGASRLAELPRVRVRAVERVHVQHFGPDADELVARS